MTTIQDDFFANLHRPTLESVSISDDECQLIVNYSVGRQYTVPFDYLRQWYDRGPHEQLDPDERPAKVLARIIEDGDLIHVTFADGAVYLVAWDTILMACEPKYVHFGGFTEYSKKITKTRHQSSSSESSEGPR